MRRISQLQPHRFGLWAVVTGGSSGIGRALADILGKHGFNLILAARRAAELGAAAEQLRTTHRVAVETVATDLSTTEGVDMLLRAAASRDVGIFVGNAGAASPGWFTDIDISEFEKCIGLKIRANMRLSHHFARIMRAKGRGAILLVSSTGGRQGVPYISNNAASEAYVLSLGEALHYELKPHGVHVSVLLPGPTATPALARMAANPDDLPMRPMSAEATAHEGLRALVRGKPTWIAGRMNRFASMLLSRRMGTRLMGKMIGQVFAVGKAQAAGIAP